MQARRRRAAFRMPSVDTCHGRTMTRPVADRVPSKLTLGVAVTTALVCLLSACGGTATSDGKSQAGACTQAEIDPASFVDPTRDTNPYHPLKPGMQWVRGGTTEVGSRKVPFTVTSTMTDVVRQIDGVPAIAMLDESTDAGEVAEVGMDYLALDKDGNVWIFGGYTEAYEGGQFTDVESAWLGASDSTLVGILAPAKVTADTPQWCISAADGEKPSVGKPVQVGVKHCVKFGCYKDVRVVQEGEVDAPDNENKYYAPGVGVIDNVPLDASLHQDTFQLLNFIELTPSGTARKSKLVLDLEAHARTVAPDVFADAPDAKRVR